MNTIDAVTTNAAARFMFIRNETIIFCTADLSHLQEVVSHDDMGHFAPGDQVAISGTDYEIETIEVEHYSWPVAKPALNQTGEPYAYTVNLTIYLADV